MSLSDYIIGIKNASGDMPPNQGHTCKNCKHFHPATDEGYYCSKYFREAAPGAACASWEMKVGASPNETARPNSSRK